MCCVMTCVNLTVGCVWVLLCVCVQVSAKEAEVSRLANDVDSLGLQLGRARGELAKQVCVSSSPLPLPPAQDLKSGRCPEV